MRLLLQSGADACSHDWRASTPLHYAAEGFPEVVSLLCEHAMDLVDAKNADGDTPLHLACISQSYDSALQLLQTAADPNIENNEGAVPLAAAQGNERIVELLESYGAKHTLPARLHVTPLMIPDYVVSPKTYAASPPSSPGSCHPLSPQARGAQHRTIRTSPLRANRGTTSASPSRIFGCAPKIYGTPYESNGDRFRAERMRQYRERRKRRKNVKR